MLCLGGRVVELAIDGGFGGKGDGARTGLLRALSERVEAVMPLLTLNFFPGREPSSLPFQPRTLSSNRSIKQAATDLGHRFIPFPIQ